MVSLQPKVSIILLNYNGRRALGHIFDACLRSLMATDYPDFEVLFVDNASTDDSIQYVTRRHGQDSRLKVVHNQRNFGYAEGNNVGLRIAKGKYLALLNSDTRVEATWLQALVDAVESPAVGAAQSKLLRMDSPDLLDCAGGMLDYYGYQFERGQAEKAEKYSESAEVFYAKGASFLVKREVLAKTGLFDPDVFLYFDEADLCWRIWLSGYKVVYAPASVVRHASGSTASGLQQQSRLFYYTRNHVVALLKNYGLKKVFQTVGVTVLFEFRNSALFLLRRKPLVALSLMKGLFWNLTHLKTTWQKRQRVQSFVRKIGDEDLQLHMFKPVAPFPLYLVFPRSKYTKKGSEA
jgi:GT2 family glycosyltransferase